MTPQLLDIAASTKWREGGSSTYCSAHILSWLLDETSLTKKLQQTCQDFTVRVIQQSNTDGRESALSPYFVESAKVLVREVILYCDDLASVFAQTEIPHRTLSDKQKKLADIGDQSLGKFLFKEKSLQRSKIEIAEFTVGSELHQLCESLQQPCEHSLWARRSLFYVENKPLLVSEVFLPGSGIYS